MTPEQIFEELTEETIEEFGENEFNPLHYYIIPVDEFDENTMWIDMPVVLKEVDNKIYLIEEESTSNKLGKEVEPYLVWL